VLIALLFGIDLPALNHRNDACGLLTDPKVGYVAHLEVVEIIAEDDGGLAVVLCFVFGFVSPFTLRSNR